MRKTWAQAKPTWSVVTGCAYSSFSYLFWLANNKKDRNPEFCMSYSDETWYVGSEGHSYYPRVCRYRMHNMRIYNTHLHICYNKKGKPQSTSWHPTIPLTLFILCVWRERKPKTAKL